jgi:hypothetical protein
LIIGCKIGKIHRVWANGKNNPQKRKKRKIVCAFERTFKNI